MKRWFRSILFLTLAAVLLLPVLSLSAAGSFNKDLDYPRQPSMIRTINWGQLNASRISNISASNQLTFRKSSANDRAVLEWVKGLLADPAGHEAAGITTTKNGKPIVDYWVFKAGYSGNFDGKSWSSNALWNDKRTETYGPFNYPMRPVEITLNSSADALEPSVDNFEVIYLDFSWAFDKETFKYSIGTAQEGGGDSASCYLYTKQDDEFLPNETAKYDAASRTFSFDTNQYGWFALAYFGDPDTYLKSADTTPAGDDKNSTPVVTRKPTENPTTGDNGQLVWCILMAVSLSVAVVMIRNPKKQQE